MAGRSFPHGAQVKGCCKQGRRKKTDRKKALVRTVRVAKHVHVVRHLLFGLGLERVACKRGPEAEVARSTQGSRGALDMEALRASPTAVGLQGSRAVYKYGNAP